MTISAAQRRNTEDRIRAAIDRLLRGQVPPGGGYDVKPLAAEAGVSRAALYRTYGHLKTEFEQRLARLRADGHQPDPRAARSCASRTTTPTYVENSPSTNWRSAT
ncbi:hypothetical protein A6A25_30620 [Saccharothrix sp. CB00851]|nr:hypothetical protein A6A25_30620 [Saccharothrix sp. CB00851]